MLKIDMLPAANGDALWIEYGEAATPRRLLIDGGTRGTWEAGLKARIEALPAAERVFELLIVTHIDGDHIEGALALLQDETLGVQYRDIWFNGWKHLPDTGLEPLGPVEGELLTDALVNGGLPWNEAFGGRAVCINADGELPRVELADELFLTVLSPGTPQLAALRPVWRQEVIKAGLDPDRPREPAPVAPIAGLERLGAETLPDVAALASTRFERDTAEANGTSIVVLLEHDGATALLCGDAFPAVVQSSVEHLVSATPHDRLAVDAFKLPHHGSRFNISSDLLQRLASGRYLFSSSGVKTKHPHLESVARVLEATADHATLYFNYETHFNAMWRDPTLQQSHDYEALYPPEGQTGISVEL